MIKLKRLLLLIPLLLLITSCENAFIDSKTNPQPIQAENITDPEITNTTNETTEVEGISKEVFIPKDNNLTLYFLDVIGDATIIQYKDYSALVNSGFEEDSEKILKSLRNLGIGNLNYAFATNTQLKNIGGMPYIILRATPSSIVESGIPSNSVYRELYNNTQVVQQDKVFTMDKVILHTLVAYDDGGGFLPRMEDNSLVIKVSYGNVDYLLMSDCGMECEERIGDVSADILKISDSCEATSLLFLQKVKPDVAVVSTSSEDFCPNIVNRFKYADIPLYITSKDGDIFITTDGLKYSVGFNNG